MPTVKVVPMGKVPKDRRRLIARIRQLSDRWFGGHSSHWASRLLEVLEERPTPPGTSVELSTPRWKLGQSGNPSGRPKGLAYYIQGKTHKGRELINWYLAIWRGEKEPSGAFRNPPNDSRPRRRFWPTAGAGRRSMSISRWRRPIPPSCNTMAAQLLPGLSEGYLRCG
jgi:hypothetical protein